jgi:hypothetical protein
MADDSTPGDPLYPVDRTVEEARVALSMDEEATLKTKFEVSQERLEELEQLRQEGAEGEQVRQAAMEYRSSIRETALSLADVPPEDVDDEVITRLQEVGDVHLDVLARVHEQASQEAESAVERAITESEMGLSAALDALRGQIPDNIRTQLEENIQQSQKRRGGPRQGPLQDEAERGIP